MMSQGTLRVAAGVAVLLGLAGGIAAYEHLSGPAISQPMPYASPVPTPAGTPLDSECLDEYTQLAAALDDVPTTLPAPLIDLHRGAAEFRLYATPVTPDTRQILLDCSTTTDGAITATLSASASAGVEAISSVNGPAYYRDYLPDGSGALVGVASAQATNVTATVDGAGPPPTVTLTSGYFVVWPPVDDLDAVHITVTDTTGRPTVLDAPTTVSGTPSVPALADACGRELAGRTDPPFKGATGTPLIESIYNDINVYLYTGSNMTAVCLFDASEHIPGCSVYTDLRPAGIPVYGMRTFVGTGNDGGIVTGFVPRGVTSVEIINGSDTFEADVADGIFAGWIPAGMFSGKATRVVAVSPSHTYTYTGSGSKQPD
jgi:hypothetical protein